MVENSPYLCRGASKTGSAPTRGRDSACHAPGDAGAVREFVNMEAELGRWCDRYREFALGMGMRRSDYVPAVKLGIDAYVRAHGRPVDALKTELMGCYLRTRGVSRLSWDQAWPVVETVWRGLQKQGAGAFRHAAPAVPSQRG
ncbi:hypothetical protein [Luteimonas aquatica]|uniref:hypothetical protein n=1 Tax=Luteimonas aquatica TaxID=450364 RepID=UPI001F571287|nr:hypothetical protein [Luteimonas aquatica]